MNILNDFLTRRSFRVIIILSLQNKRTTFINSLINCKYIKTYTIINEIIVLEVCKQL